MKLKRTLEANALSSDCKESGNRPQDVGRAVKLLASGVGVSLFATVKIILEDGVGTGIHARAIVTQLIIIALSSVLISLIWTGIAWAKNIYLSMVTCQAIILIGGAIVHWAFDTTADILPIAFSGTQWISLALQCDIAYMLCQPDSSEWFE